MVVPHQAATIRGMKGQRTGDAVRLFRRGVDCLDPETGDRAAFINDLLTVEIKQVRETMIAAGHANLISPTDIALQRRRLLAGA
jgi:hypothetical protein